MSKTSLIKSFLLLFALAPLSGCMVTPNEGDVLSSISEQVRTAGFTLNPNELIEVQTEHPQFGWITIGKFKTDSYPRNGFGYDWYSWGGEVQIPKWAWTATSRQSFPKARIRAFGSQTSCVLMNFKEDWCVICSSVEGDEELATIVKEKGHSAPVTIWATDY